MSPQGYHPPLSGVVIHYRSLSDGKTCRYCGMTPEQYRAEQKAWENKEEERQARIIARAINIALDERVKR